MNIVKPHLSPDRFDTSKDVFLMISSHQKKSFSIDSQPKGAPSKKLNLVNNSIPFIQKRSSKKDNRLQNKASKLDILDSQMTSFPLAPPPPNTGELNRSPEFNAVDDANTTVNSVFFEVDPIVLVEDYIQRQKLARKKLSVLDLKISMKNFENDGETGSDDTTGQINYLSRCRSILTNNASSSFARNISLSTNDTRVEDQYLLTTNVIMNDKEIENENNIDLNDFLQLESTPIEITNIAESSAESILSKSTFKSSINATSIATLKLSDDFDQPIPEFSLYDVENSLKYCIICESPLYYLSSLLTSSHKFNEFVCCTCTEKYEALSKLVDDFDQEISKFEPIREDVEDIEEALNRNCSRSRNSSSGSAFSNNLISKLQNQLNGDFSDENIKKQKMWYFEARRKLRWRWRISGLLPKFLNRSIYGAEVG